MGGRGGPKNAPGADCDPPTGSSGNTTRPLASWIHSLGFRERLGTAAIAADARREAALQAPEHGSPVHDRAVTQGTKSLTVRCIAMGRRFDTSCRDSRLHGNSWLSPASLVRGVRIA